MKKFLTAVSALAMLSGTAHAADDATLSLFKPAGSWTLDVGDDYCRISRPFSDGTQQLTFAMERVQPVNMARVLLIGNGIKVFRSADQFDYTLLPSGGARKGPFWRSETADKQQFLSMGDVLIAPAPAAPSAGAGVRRRRWISASRWNSRLTTARRNSVSRKGSRL